MASLDVLRIFRNVEDKFLWKGACLEQVCKFETLSKIVRINPEIVGRHNSKSIVLPVVKFGWPNLTLILRDNFYNINMWVRSAIPIELEYCELFVEYDMEWYRQEITRSRNYSYNGWSDIQMEDPTVLCRDKNDNFPKSKEEKQRWIDRMSSTQWYEHDWSRGRLIVMRPDGNLDNEPFADNTKFYFSPTCFAEGMGNAGKAPHYEKGSKCFIISIDNWDNVYRIVPLLIKSIGQTPLYAIYEHKGKKNE